MKIIASRALVFCVIRMIVCRVLEAIQPWLVLVGAFFEAGTVGALADWFAVVALFRHPMGIPIPHTAILPNNKARVADSLEKQRLKDDIWLNSSAKDTTKRPLIVIANKTILWSKRSTLKEARD